MDEILGVIILLLVSITIIFFDLLTETIRSNSEDDSFSED